MSPSSSLPAGAASTGLVLTGGGARAAYQVGVLQGVRVILDSAGTAPKRSPFGVVCGTSAGAINAAALACRADVFDEALDTIAQVWENFSADQVYESDVLSVMRTGTRWLTMLTAGWALRRSWKLRPRSLFDNTPLVNLLQKMIDFERLEQVMSHGDLHALAITASDYSSGRNVTFYQSHNPLQPWNRTQRIAVPDKLSIDHLLASSAIPFIFPATPLYLENRLAYFGDGSMRQQAPISPAIHLGAERVFVVGAGQINAPNRFMPPPPEQGGNSYPTLAQIAGHAMSSIFLDSLAMDVERLERINKTISLIPPEKRRESTLREIDVLVIAPSERLDTIAARHIHSLPRPVRALLGAIGATEAKGAALASYLLFEKSFTSELMRLGFSDVLKQRAEVLRFFCGETLGGETLSVNVSSGSSE